MATCGLGVHDGPWAGVFSGGMGTAMTWWWDNLIAVEPDLYYPMFASDDACPSFDANGNDTVTVGELVAGVDAAPDGCSAG